MNGPIKKAHRNYGRLLIPALAVSVACHLLAALVPEKLVRGLAGTGAPAEQRSVLELIVIRPEQSTPLYVETEEEPVPSAPGGELLAPSPARLRPSPSLLAMRSLPGALRVDAVEPPSAPTTPTAGAAIAPPANDLDSLAAMESYLAGVYDRIRRARRYPEIARRLGREGEVELGFAIGRSGDISGNPVVVEATPWSSLNSAALGSLRASSPFPPLPDCVLRDSLPVRVRIVYRLE